MASTSYKTAAPDNIQERLEFAQAQCSIGIADILAKAREDPDTTVKRSDILKIEYCTDERKIRELHRILDGLNVPRNPQPLLNRLPFLPRLSPWTIAFTALPIVLLLILIADWDLALGAISVIALLISIYQISWEFRKFVHAASKRLTGIVSSRDR